VVDANKIENSKASHTFSDKDKEAIMRDMEALGYF